MAIAFTPTVTNIRLDNMHVTIGGTAMGLTQGGIEITIEGKTLEVKSDQYGDTVVQTFNVGDRVTIKLGLLEATLANLHRVLYSGISRSSGGTAEGVGGKLSSSIVGTTRAVAIILHPLDTDDGTLTASSEINIWKAVPIGGLKLALGPNNVTFYEQEFLAILDTTKAATFNGLIDFGLTAAT